MFVDSWFELFACNFFNESKSAIHGIGNDCNKLNPELYQELANFFYKISHKNSTIHLQTKISNLRPIVLVLFNSW